MSAAAPRLAGSSLVHVGVAFLAMGGWALFANRAHAFPAPLAAGMVQGAMSAAITFVLKRMIEGLAARLPSGPALVLPPLAAIGLSIALLTAMHWLAGTPEILATIIVPVSVTALYSSLYSAALRRSRKAGHDRS